MVDEKNIYHEQNGTAYQTFSVAAVVPPLIVLFSQIIVFWYSEKDQVSWMVNDLPLLILRRNSYIFRENVLPF